MSERPLYATLSLNLRIPNAEKKTFKTLIGSYVVLIYERRNVIFYLMVAGTCKTTDITHFKTLKKKNKILAIQKIF